MLIMWGDKVSAPLNIVHLGFGIGAMFSNLLVKPFLGEKQIIETSLNNQTRFIENKLTNIRIPYSITSFLCLIISIIHVILSIREYRNRNESVKNPSTNYSSVAQSIDVKKVKKYSEYSPRVWGNGNLSYGLTLSIIWILYMFFLGGNDQTFGKFFFEFLKTPQFSISTSGATWGMVTYWLSYSVFPFSTQITCLSFHLDRSFNLCRNNNVSPSSLRNQWIMGLWISIGDLMVYICMDN